MATSPWSRAKPCSTEEMSATARSEGRTVQRYQTAGATPFHPEPLQIRRKQTREDQSPPLGKSYTFRKSAAWSPPERRHDANEYRVVDRRSVHADLSIVRSPLAVSPPTAEHDLAPTISRGRNVAVHRIAQERGRSQQFGMHVGRGISPERCGTTLYRDRDEVPVILPPRAGQIGVGSRIPKSNAPHPQRVGKPAQQSEENSTKLTSGGDTSSSLANTRVPSSSPSSENYTLPSVSSSARNRCSSISSADREGGGCGPTVPGEICAVENRQGGGAAGRRRAVSTGPSANRDAGLRQASRAPCNRASNAAECSEPHSPPWARWTAPSVVNSETSGSYSVDPRLMRQIDQLLQQPSVSPLLSTPLGFLVDSLTQPPPNSPPSAGWEASMNSTRRDRRIPRASTRSQRRRSITEQHNMSQVMSTFSLLGDLQGQYPLEAEEVKKGLDKSLLQALPTSTFVEPRVPSQLEEQKSCMICLESFQRGATLRWLPCLHTFHVGCIDTWLNTSGTCPICKCRIEEVSRGNSVSQLCPSAASQCRAGGCSEGNHSRLEEVARCNSPSADRSVLDGSSSGSSSPTTPGSPCSSPPQLTLFSRQGTQYAAPEWSSPRHVRQTRHPNSPFSSSPSEPVTSPSFAQCSPSTTVHHHVIPSNVITTTPFRRIILPNAVVPCHGGPNFLNGPVESRTQNQSYNDPPRHEIWSCGRPYFTNRWDPASTGGPLRLR